MEFNVMETDDVDSYVQSKIIEPAINGMLILLKSVVKSKSVKRVIFTSSISTLTAKFNNTGKWRPIVDEYCQCDVDHAWQAKQSGWVYVVSKSMSEDAAFRFAYQNKIDLVSIITTTVAGPYLTPNVPSRERERERREKASDDKNNQFVNGFFLILFLLLHPGPSFLSLLSLSL